MRTPILLIVALLLTCLVLPAATARGDAEDKAPPTRVTVTVELPAEVNSFDDAALIAVLYEYDPMLADAPANEVDRLVIRNLGHQQGVEQSLRFHLGDKLGQRQPRRAYYISCRIYEDKGDDTFKKGEQLHYCHNEHERLPGTVYDETNGTALTFKAR